jgi:site-specific recombinase XerD
MKRRIIVKTLELPPKISSQEAIQNFINHRISMNLSLRTLKWYKYILEFIFEDLHKNGVDTNSLQSIKREDLELFVSCQLERGVKAITINGHLRSLNALFRYLKSRRNSPVGLADLSHWAGVCWRPLHADGG